MNPIALACLLVLCAATLLLPRRHAIAPLLIMIGTMPMGQELVVFGLHFHLFRILLLVGLIRIVIRGELAAVQWTTIDKLFLWWLAVTVSFGSLSQPSSSLFFNRLGDVYNAFCAYVFARCILLDIDDVARTVRSLAWISLPIAGLMLVEWNTGRNLLHVLGGVPEYVFIRNGELRCQGAFRHPILAGAYGASQFPLFAGLAFRRGENRVLLLLACLASLVIVFTSSSSGAVLALGGAIAGLGLWWYRDYMALFRRLGVIGILCAAAIMNAPVWYLMARISNVVGGTGWHRAWLIDMTVQHFDEWWLFGTTYTAHWGPAGEVIAADPNMMDITNHFIMEGVKGGVLKMGLFIAIVVASFRVLGTVLKNAGLDPRANRCLVWGIGVSLFTHCVAFISVNYFDQTIIIWYLLIAVICASSQHSMMPTEVAKATRQLNMTLSGRVSHGR